ncbi:high-affinity Zn(2+) transporter zrt1 [Apophysomyces sp. BC1034]|nr:high-affinity Zn(2+) transporter zrt1 [Apophysomyces sp. BC1015]KAG0183388.1 high-affinity Zn(2+) transporter zrt1 [Apophysomyces sp. BC1021]KAG0194618.1 high-affinity Zn(2+) transporter zrt1 [Apophysomyces sp. BC1034]
MQKSCITLLAFATLISLVRAQHSHAGHSHDHEGDAEACEAEHDHEYDLSMRIGSIFIILATSAIGIFGPIILHRINPYSRGGIRDWILTVGKFFGTGVILATAFVHMLPESLERFGSPCLDAGWQSYHAFAGVFCMIASFALQLLELAALSNLDRIIQKRKDREAALENGADHKVVSENHAAHAGEMANGHDHKGFAEDGHVHSAGLLEDDQSIKNIGTLILELGILMHSIIIGITLGTIGTGEFNTLLIALVFHQFFEGIALGTRINDLNCKSWVKPIVMGLLFIITTPFGVAIGVGIHESFNPLSSSSVLAQAILDSLSAGILLYNAYVSLMSIEINHNAAFRKSSLIRKAVCFLSMYIGAALMAVLGTWA